jgi:serine/threonine protein kinase
VLPANEGKDNSPNGSYFFAFSHFFNGELCAKTSMSSAKAAAAAKRRLNIKPPAARKPAAVYGAAGFSGTPGRLEDCYKPSTILGQGAFGKVSLAHHLLTGHPVAVKSYTSAVFSNPALAAALKSEVRLLQRLSHPNVLRLFETIKQRHHMHVVTEFAPGQTVRALLRRRGKGRHTRARALQAVERGIGEAEARVVFQQLASAVAHVHANGIVHRDIKLDNIVLVPNAEVDAEMQLPGGTAAAPLARKRVPAAAASSGAVLDAKHCRVKLIDFGLAGLAPPGTAPFTDFCGTVPYMAPELWNASDARNRNKAGRGGAAAARKPRAPVKKAKAGAAATAASATTATVADVTAKVGYGQPVDIWAMGVTLYVMLTDNFPFWAGSEDRLRKDIDKGLDMEALPAALSPELRSILAGMLTVDPSRRLDANGVKHHPWLDAGVAGGGGDEGECAMAEVAVASAPPPAGAGWLAQTLGWGDVVVPAAAGADRLDSTLVRARGTKREAQQACDAQVLATLQARAPTLDVAKVAAAVQADERNHFSACYLLEQRVQRAVARHAQQSAAPAAAAAAAPSSLVAPRAAAAGECVRPTPPTALRDSNGRSRQHARAKRPTRQQHLVARLDDKTVEQF